MPTARRRLESKDIPQADSLENVRRIVDAVVDGLRTKAEVSEESVGLGEYGKVLTVLVSSSIGQEDDPDVEEEDDDSVIERWTPRFHR